MHSEIKTLIWVLMDLGALLDLICIFLAPHSSTEGSAVWYLHRFFFFFLPCLGARWLCCNTGDTNLCQNHKKNEVFKNQLSVLLSH